MPKIPKVFVSYSHDSPTHKQWVAALAVRLRQNGIDAVLDQWDLFPGEDIPSFVERHLAECNYALLICTKRYVEKANSGEGGVGYEKMIVSAELAKKIQVSKFIPILRQSGSKEVPYFISSKLFLDFSVNSEFEVVFDHLLRAIYRSALQIKPPLGPMPTIGATTVRNRPRIDLPSHVISVFKEMLVRYDRDGEDGWSPEDLAEGSGLGLLKTENALTTLKSQAYVSQDANDFWSLTSKGKLAALDYNLIEDE